MTLTVSAPRNDRSRLRRVTRRAHLTITYTPTGGKPRTVTRSIGL